MTGNASFFFSACPVNNDQAISPDTVCLSCGYCLHGLSPEGRCPECEMPVERSLRGGGLRAADPAYVRRLQLGAEITIVSVLADVGWLVITPLALFVGVQSLNLTISAAMLISLLAEFVAATLGLWGWWLLTTANPAQVVKDDRASRRVLRTLLVCGAAAILAQVVTRFVPALANSQWGVLSGNIVITPSTQWTVTLITALSLRGLFLVLKVAKFFTGLVYLRALAAAIPSVELRKRCGRQLWYVPLMGTVGLVIVVGPVLAVYSYVQTLWMFRGAFREALLTRAPLTGYGTRPRPENPRAVAAG